MDGSRHSSRAARKKRACAIISPAWRLIFASTALKRRCHRSTDTSPVSKIGYSLYPLNWFRLGLIDKYTLHFIGISSALAGLWWGILSVAAFVLKKTMGASNLEVTIFTMLMPVTSIVAIFATEWMRGRDKRAFIFWSGLIGRLPLAAMLFISQSAPFLVLSALAFLSGAVITPAMNSLLQTNLTRSLLGKMYAVLGVIITIAVIAATVFAGYALERDPNAYHWLFAAGGVLGFLSSTALARARFRRSAFLGKRTLYLRHRPLKDVLHDSIVVPLRNNWAILRKNRPFALFERNFMIYGLAFMILLPVVPIFLVERLNIEYAQVGIALGIFSQVGTLVLLPVFGYIYDRLHPVSFSRWVFVILGFFPLTLLFSLPLSALTGTDPIFWVFIAYLIFGFGMAGVQIVWMLAAIFFARAEDSAPYSGIHVTLVGVRGLIGPLAGYTINEIWGACVVFIVGAVLFWIATILMWKLCLDIRSGRVAEMSAQS